MNPQRQFVELATSAEGCQDGMPSTDRFWRSLEEAASAPEFEQYLHREFPSQLAVWEDSIGRRRFLELMAASLALAGVTGCTRSPQEAIVPYVRQPEEIVQGLPLYYATALGFRGYGLGVLVENHMGRPTKIEGNAEHPITRGATNSLLQASLLQLYDPDRSQTILHRGLISTWDAFAADVGRLMEGMPDRQGRGLRILTEAVTSPTLVDQLESLLESFPEARWHSYEPAGQSNADQGATLAFGQVVQVDYQLAQADVIVSLDADFLLTHPASVRYARDFIEGRRVVRDSSRMNRLYVAESTPTMTGAMADHRIALPPSQVEPLAREILRRVRLPAVSSTTEPVEEISAAWLQVVARDLAEHRGRGVVLAGPGQPPIVHALAHAINEALENSGKTVRYLEPVEVRPSHERGTLGDLVTDMAAGDVEVLLILGGNPVYNAPGELNFEQQLARIPKRIHFSESYDETSFLCDWHIPATDALESWGDVRAWDGTTTIVQPLIAPLYEGRTVHELLALFQGQSGKSAFELVQAHWQRQLGDDFARSWRRALHDGVVADSQSKVVDVRLREDFDGEASASPVTSAESAMEIEFRPDPTVDDGRFANNGWLQELPKPLSKLTWDNAAYVSPKTASRLGLKTNDVVEITVDGRSIRAPVWLMPGQSENCVSLTFGYGRTRAGRLGDHRGYNAFTLLPASGAWFARGTLRATGETYRLVTTQQHHSLEGRDIVRVTTLQGLKDHPEQPQDAKHHGEGLPTLYPPHHYEGNAWGMVIDQTACIGCNACVVACQSENNIPIVGKEQVALGREMHWIRIDRYYHGELEHPETYFQPMMCVHCENAPCEVVCPVAATVHDSEGTSNMIYNRCVGTRYCSNNCPYKVRRFNYLQYSDGTTASLKLLRNPDVTVRSRGVMEKCSYCVQRLDLARIEAKKNRQPLVRDGEVLTACQQACPTQAITFGNLNDPSGALKKLKTSALNYGVLAELQTEPRTTYLARVVNPHQQLPSPTAANPDIHLGDKDKAHS